jgi:EKC/KEOPS complex subunit PCC1/LAGE3
MASGASTSANAHTTTASLRVLFSSAEHAAIAHRSLSVDAELSPARVTRTLSVEGQHLVTSFAAADARSLRLSIGAFFDMLGVVVRTLRDFGDDDDLKA